MEKKSSFIAVIVTIAIQTGTMIWWASSLTAQVRINTDNIATMQRQMTTTVAVTLTRDQLNDILNSRDVQITSLSNDLNDFKKEVRSSLNRIENKLQ